MPYLPFHAPAPWAFAPSVSFPEVPATESPYVCRKPNLWSPSLWIFGSPCLVARAWQGCLSRDPLSRRLPLHVCRGHLGLRPVRSCCDQRRGASSTVSRFPSLDGRWETKPEAGRPFRNSFTELLSQMARHIRSPGEPKRSGNLDGDRPAILSRPCNAFQK